MSDPIILELTKQIANLQRQVDGLIKPEIRLNLISPFLSLPGLVGFWPMSSIQRSTGNVYDLSGQARTLTYNGNPVYNYSGLVSYYTFDGVGDYLSRADETDLDILGTESIYNSSVRGLTLGGWFYFNSLPVITGLITKDDVGANRSYSMFQAGTSLQAVVFGTGGGGAYDQAVGSTVLTTGRWYHCITRFIPGTELAVFLNGVKDGADTTTVNTAITNSTTELRIGYDNGAGRYFIGRASLCFLCANSLSDNLISSLFQQTRTAFGV